MPLLDVAPHDLWELACLRWYPCGLPDRPQRLYREQARSHMDLAVMDITQPVGAGLPAMVSPRFAWQTVAPVARASPLSH